MSEITTNPIGLIKRLTVDGLIIEGKVARKPHICCVCQSYIQSLDYYYCVYLAGAGLSNIKFPDKLHTDCINQYWRQKNGRSNQHHA